MQKLDTRYLSGQSYQALIEVKKAVVSEDYGKASSAVQSLPAYISTWGLHRLCGDAIKYTRPDASEKTRYKGKVYRQFLTTLKTISGESFDLTKPETLIGMDIHRYSGLNRLAIQLAREWSFWSVTVLGKGEN